MASTKRKRRRKPPSNCTVCGHPQRAAVDRMLVDKEPAERVVALFGLSMSAVYRHRNHIPALVQEALDGKRISRSVYERVEKSAEKIEAALDASVPCPDMLPNAAEFRHTLQLAGTLNGEIKPAQVNNFFVSLGMSQEQVEALVERHKELESYSLDDAEKDLLEAWSLIRESDPERADRIRSEILGGSRVELAQEAVGED